MEYTNVAEIKAEVLLNHLYPELTDRWIVENKGTFYRNYSEDVMQIEEDVCKVALSRDGFLRLLPQGLITTDDELKGRGFQNKYENLKIRKSQLEELFRPVDTWRFRKSMREEKELARLLDEKLDILLKKYFQVDRNAEKNPYVKEMMVLLPMVRHLRANFGRIGDIIAALLGYRVSMTLSRYDWTGCIRDAQPLVTYQIWIPNLQNEDYKVWDRELEALRNFISEWFIPFDTRCLMEVKCDTQAALDNRLTLNYNTRLK